MADKKHNLNRRELLHSGAALLGASIIGSGLKNVLAEESSSTSSAPLRASVQSRPNIVYFLVDNLGYGELGCYGGGILRGADTRRIDEFAKQGMKLLNFAPEAQCSPSRSALMTGRYAIRAGNHTVALAGTAGGLVAWENT